VSAPRWTHWLLTRLAGPDRSDEVLGDLEETHHERTRRLGRARATLLTSLEAIDMASALLRERRRERKAIDGALPRDPLRGQRREPVFSWLDVKLGLRMLVKYPVMSLVSGFAIAVTIAVAIGVFSFFQDFLLRPTVPLEEGDRIVSLGLRTPGRSTDRRLLHEFFAWKDELESVQQLSIWRFETRTIVSPEGGTRPARFGVMSASGFEVARVPPLLGRPLLQSDEIVGAPPVLVIGHDEWVDRFDSDPEIVGRQVQIGRDQHTIVGVMPEGFTFPLAHQLWLPFADDPDDFPMMQAPAAYFAFGRLAPGVTLAQAQAELTALTNRRAERHPETHAQMRALVMPYTDAHTGMDGSGDADILFGRVILGALTLIVLIPFANVAILVYARTATRAGEMAVRNALGASRKRVVTQLFAEGLVLATLSAAAGIGIALFIGGRVEELMGMFWGGRPPFWVKMGRDPWAFAYATGLGILAAVVAGAVPGLQATGKGMQATLKRTPSGDGPRLGKTWTGLVVTQVAITVALLPLAGFIAWQALGMGMSRPTFAAEEYLQASIAGPPLEAAVASGQASNRVGQAIEEVVRRLEADPRVIGVALSSRPPDELLSVAFSDFARIDIDGVEPPLGELNHSVGRMAVDAGFFTHLGVPVERGREFTPADVASVPQPVVVNRAFVERALGGANPIGRQIREYRAPDQEPAPWREIVGVVGELAENPLRPELAESRIFTPFDRIRMRSAFLTAHAPSSPADVVSELQRISIEVDPGLILGARRLSDSSDPEKVIMRGVSLGIGLVLSSVLLLCTAGVFALISFNVTKRHKEIGIRSALGASPRRVLVTVLAQSATQLSIGVVVGLLVVAITPEFSLDGLPIDRDPRLIAGVAAIMVVVGLLAAVGPARRGLRVQPTDALKEG
jgi:predicted permease